MGTIDTLKTKPKKYNECLNLIRNISDVFSGRVLEPFAQISSENLSKSPDDVKTYKLCKEIYSDLTDVLNKASASSSPCFNDELLNKIEQNIHKQLINYTLKANTGNPIETVKELKENNEKFLDYCKKRFNQNYAARVEASQHH